MAVWKFRICTISNDFFESQIMFYVYNGFMYMDYDTIFYFPYILYISIFYLSFIRKEFDVNISC